MSGNATLDDSLALLQSLQDTAERSWRAYQEEEERHHCGPQPDGAAGSSAAGQPGQPLGEPGETLLTPPTKAPGEADALEVGSLIARQVGMHSHDTLHEACDEGDGFAPLLARLLRAQGDEVELAGNTLSVAGFRLMRGLDPHPAVFRMWCAAFEGLLSVHDRFAKLEATRDSAGMQFVVSR